MFLHMMIRLCILGQFLDLGFRETEYVVEEFAFCVLE